MPDQFLRDGSNQRSDAYGGSIANRACLMLEVVDAVCGVWGANRVGIRLSPLQPFNDMRDSNPEATFAYIVEQLNRFGLAYLHVTEMGKESPGAAGPAFDLQKLRTIWQGVYMTNGGYDLARGNAALALGFADMIAFGVPFLANPDFSALRQIGAAQRTRPGDVLRRRRAGLHRLSVSLSLRRQYHETLLQPGSLLPFPPHRGA